MRSILKLILLLNIILICSCEEEPTGPVWDESLEDDVYHRDHYRDTDVVFNIDGEEYFTEDFLPNLDSYFRYNNRRLVFNIESAALFKEVNGERIKAGFFYLTLAKSQEYEGGDKATFSNVSAEQGTDGYYISLLIRILEEDGINGTDLPFPDYEVQTDGFGNPSLSASNWIPTTLEGPNNTYQLVSGNISFGGISSYRAQGNLSGTLANFVEPSLPLKSVSASIDLKVTWEYDMTSDERQVYADDGGSNSGGGNACSDLDYNGPQQGQAKQWCQYAQFLDCNGLIEERDVQCQILEDYGASCPYCP